MSDALAASLASDAPVADTPAVAPVEAPLTPTAEPSRRDTIREAVEAQKAKATDGDNPGAPKVAAKAPSAPVERPRDLSGKFASATDKPAPDKPAAPAQAAVAPVAPTGDAPAPSADDTPRPPPGWSPASKVAFDALPDSVKADIAKREKEVNEGFRKLAEYKPVEKFVEMAKRGGTTLDQALEEYVGIEQLIARDPIAAVERILQNRRVNPQAFARAFLTKVGGGDQTPGMPTAPATNQTALDPQALVRQATEAARAQFQQEQAQQAALTEVQRFEADPKNRFYANVKPTMARLIQNGFATTIQDAYDQACRLDPEISRLLNQPPAPDPRVAAASQARAQGRATVGAPSPGATSARNGVPANASRREVIRAAIDAQKGARA